MKSKKIPNIFSFISLYIFVAEYVSVTCRVTFKINFFKEEEEESNKIV